MADRGGDQRGRRENQEKQGLLLPLRRHVAVGGVAHADVVLLTESDEALALEVNFEFSTQFRLE